MDFGLYQGWLWKRMSSCNCSKLIATSRLSSRFNFPWIFKVQYPSTLGIAIENVDGYHESLRNDIIDIIVLN